MNLSNVFRTGCAFVALTLAGATAHAAVDAWTDTTVGAGVIWRQKTYTSLYGGKQTVNVLQMEMSNSAVRVQPLRPSSGCATTSALGSSFGAAAAVNAGFFAGGDCSSVSMIKINNIISAVNPGYKPPRSTFGYNRTTKGLFIAPISSTDSWSAVNDAVGGGPNLVTNGASDVTLTAEGFDASYASKNPRTAVGYAGTRLLFVTVDGRTSAGVGMTLSELASFMIALGCNKAMNMDGGGSTAMWINGRGLVNTVSDGSQRSVVSALGVFISPPPIYTVDNTDAGFTASTNWFASTSTAGYLGSNYRTRATAAVSDAATWKVNLPAAGSYKVFARWTAGANRPSAVPYVVYHTGGSSTVNINQRQNNGTWVLLGTYNMAAGDSTRVALSCWTTTGFFAVADAVRLERQ